MGIFFAFGGFTVIGLGWNGMAGQACIDCQLPYLLSGGATGLGLIAFGAAILVAAQIRGERLKADDRIQELIRATGRIGVGAGESPNGFVLAGRSTYHRPDCRLVQGKELDRITVQAAADSGLTACRVCSPETVTPSDTTAVEAPKAEASVEEPEGEGQQAES